MKVTIMALVLGVMVALALAEPKGKGGGGKGSPKGYTVYQDEWVKQPYVEHVPVVVHQPQTFYKDVLVKKPIRVEHRPVTSYVDEWVLHKKPVIHYEPYYVQETGGKKGGIGGIFGGLFGGKKG